MSTQSQPGSHGADEAKPLQIVTPPDPCAVPDLLAAAPACARLQLDRADKINARHAGFRPNFEDVDVADLIQIRDGLLVVAQAYNDWCVPVTRTDLLNNLADFADMLQVTAPSDGGIELYAEAMADFPNNLLRRATVSLAKTHKFARLPYPQDFTKAVEGELKWVEAKRAWVARLIRLFTNAIDDRQQGRMI